MVVRNITSRPLWNEPLVVHCASNSCFSELNHAALYADGVVVVRRVESLANVKCISDTYFINVSNSSCLTLVFSE